MEEGTLEVGSWAVPGSLLTLWDTPSGNTATADTEAYVEQQHLAVYQAQASVLHHGACCMQ